tara:strand:+ start:116 stop:1114 length:999 start_codon:yes stop_codon:yes gene_type:complete
MGIKSLTNTIKKYSPDSIQHENLYKLSGKRVAVDASLIIYQQLLNSPNTKILRNKEGKITNHINGLFYKIMNYISLNINLIFIFDGKPPENKSDTIEKRKQKCENAKLKLKENNFTDQKEKNKLEKSTIRLTSEMINDIKYLLKLLGISYINSDGEAEALASELCRIGYVDYVLSEDMDTLVYGCPKLIRNCIDKKLKRKDIISIFNYEKILSDFNFNKDEFIDFCILCGCDYCNSVPKIGNITAFKLFQKYKNIDTIIKNTKYNFPENYLDDFNKSKENFLLFYNKINIDNLIIYNSQKDIIKLENFLIHEIQMNEKRVQNTLKKFNNNYK